MSVAAVGLDEIPPSYELPMIIANPVRLALNQATYQLISDAKEFFQALWWIKEGQGLSSKDQIKRSNQEIKSRDQIKRSDQAK